MPSSFHRPMFDFLRRPRFLIATGLLGTLSLAACVSSEKSRDRIPAQEATAAGGQTAAASGASPENEGALKHAIDVGVHNLMNDRIAGPQGSYWRYPTRLGLHFSSQYYIMELWLNVPNSKLDPKVLEKYLLRDQLPDGSWYQVKDANEIEGNFDSTIFNYWALKVIQARVHKNQPSAEINQRLQKAQSYILAHGGLDSATFFTRILLAMNGNYLWSKIPYIPIQTVTTNLGENLIVKQFSQWVIPHLKPITYLRHNMVTKHLGPEFDLRELYTSYPELALRAEGAATGATGLAARIGRQVPLESSRNLLENLILPQQLPMGSWGGYSLATLFTIAGLDYELNNAMALSSSMRDHLKSSIQKGTHFIEELYFNSGEKSSYYGVLDDSTYWDSGLAMWALAENGLNTATQRNVGSVLAKHQNQQGALAGGFPFGYDFENYPDIDDNYAIMLGLRDLSVFKQNVQDGMHFVLRRQNQDGGWGTFDVDNKGYLLLQLASQSVSDSASLFDASNPDVTGHALELIGRFTSKKTDDPMVQHAYEFLKKARNKNFPAWQARWEVNYIFGTFSVISGLTKVGYGSQDPLVRDAVQWVKSVQNADGGFGETTQSYIDESLAGRGISTASQTSWGLATLIQGGEVNSQSAARAAHYLLEQVQQNGKWNDPSAVGTGHPGILYMEYPSYPMTFPLIALGKYATAVCAQGKYSAEFCERYKSISQ